jgi:hypothetical protein
MNAGHIVSLLLDGEEDMVKHLGRLAVDPMYEITDAMQTNREFDKVFPARDPWAYELKISIQPPIYSESKLRFITVLWDRSEESKKAHLNPIKDRVHWYGSFSVKDTPAVASALKGLINAAKIATVGNSQLTNALHKLMALQWRAKNPTRRRRNSVNPRWGL